MSNPVIVSMLCSQDTFFQLVIMHMQTDMLVKDFRFKIIELKLKF